MHSRGADKVQEDKSREIEAMLHADSLEGALLRMELFLAPFG